MIRLSRFRNRLAEAEVVRRSGLFPGAAILQGIFAGPVLMSLANNLLTAGLMATACIIEIFSYHLIQAVLG